MYRITTRTSRTVHTEIDSLSEAIFKIRVLELNTKRAGIYSPGYYRIEKYGAIAACGDYNEMRILKGHYLENKKLLDVGQEIGISESRVYALHKIAVRKVEIFLKCNRK